MSTFEGLLWAFGTCFSLWMVLCMAEDLWDWVDKKRGKK